MCLKFNSISTFIVRPMFGNPSLVRYDRPSIEKASEHSQYDFFNAGDVKNTVGQTVVENPGRRQSIEQSCVCMERFYPPAVSLRIRF